MLNNVMVATGAATTEATETISGSLVDVFTDAFSELGTGIAGGVVDMFDTVFVSSTGGLSNIAIWGVLMAATGLIIGLVNWLKNKAS